MNLVLLVLPSPPLTTLASTDGIEVLSNRSSTALINEPSRKRQQTHRDESVVHCPLTSMCSLFFDA